MIFIWVLNKMNQSNIAWTSMNTPYFLSLLQWTHKSWHLKWNWFLICGLDLNFKGVSVCVCACVYRDNSNSAEYIPLWSKGLFPIYFHIVICICCCFCHKVQHNLSSLIRNWIWRSCALHLKHSRTTTGTIREVTLFSLFFLLFLIIPHKWAWDTWRIANLALGKKTKSSPDEATRVVPRECTIAK